MIPKVIHYCWFGSNPLPKSAQKCISSWKKYFPDYEIKEWNEDNFDVNIIPYTSDAYKARKYAFVSDYARFWILYHFGGVYFDTDVEVIKPLDDIINEGPFMAWEKPSNGVYRIAPGLGIATEEGLPLYLEILKGFEQLIYCQGDGTRNNYTMIPMINDIMLNHGLIYNGLKQTVGDVIIYPEDYFCPMNAISGYMTITNNTRTIHWYTMLWTSKKYQIRFMIGRFFRKILLKDL